MEKPQLNYNEYLRYSFAGGFGILCYFFLQPNIYNGLFNKDGDFKDSLLLVLISLILGSFVYAVHRAILYLVCLRILLVILGLSKKLRTSHKIFSWKFLTGQKFVIDEDFRRWKQKSDTKSFAKNLSDWFAQIHFLYCCVWVMLTAKIFSFEVIKKTDFLTTYWYYFAIALFLITLRSHYRGLLYDLSISSKDEEYKSNETNSKKLIEIKVETEE